MGSGPRRGDDFQRAAMVSYLPLERRIPADHPLRGARRLTDRAAVMLGADTQYQDERIIAALRDRAVAPQVSEYRKGKASLGKNALNEQERADPRRSISQRKRKLIVRVFGWGKPDRALQQVKMRGLKRVDWFYRRVETAHNLMRMGKLIPVRGGEGRGVTGGGKNSLQ
jgi:hypothetical protein